MCGILRKIHRKAFSYFLISTCTLKNEEELVLNIIRPDFKKVEKTSFNKEKYMY
jgi:hypothetical protein